MTKAAGNSYSPRLQPGTEVLLYYAKRKNEMNHENRLGISSGDYLAMLAKGLSGAIPVVGPAVAEVLGVMIPNQRADRFERLLVEIEERVELLEIDNAVLRARFSSPEYLDLFEDGATQAVKAFSRERIQFIAHILADGLHSAVLNYLKAKKLLLLLSQVSDPEIVYLKFYYLVQAGEPRDYSAFWRRHQDLLEPKDNSLGLPKENFEDFEIQETYKDNLVRLKLIDRGTSGSPSVTYLGSLFLNSIIDVKDLRNDTKDA